MLYVKNFTFFIFSFGLLFYQKATAQAPNISYQTPQVYTLNAAITPLQPLNTGGAVPPAIYGQVTTVAGGGNPGNFGTVTGVAVDPAGNVYLEDWSSNKIYKLTPAGALSLFAGSGNSASVDGQGTSASFYEPDGIVGSADGALYVGDLLNNQIRKISPNALVTTFAGNTNAGFTDGIGNGAAFNWPRGLAVDATGNVYVADQLNNAIRKITPAGVVTTISGNGNSGFTNGSVATATFNTPCGVGLDVSGNLYVADAGNNAIRKIIPGGMVSTFATGISFPREVRVDGSGNAYVTSEYDNKIYRISPNGTLNVLAGTGQAGANNGRGTVATFNGPLGLALDTRGFLYVGENVNNLVRKISINGYTLNKTLPAGLTFDETTGIITGTPTAVTNPTDYTITAYNGYGSSSTVVNIATDVSLPLSVINFPPPVTADIAQDNILRTGATSNNSETPITYTSNNPSIAYVGTDGQIHVIAPGVVIITAYQAGNAHYAAATPVSETFTITENQIIQVSPTNVKSICDADFQIGAVSNNPLLPLFYSSSNTTIATISASGLVHIIAAGKTTFTVSQPGNTLYKTAVPQTQELTVNSLIKPSVMISPDVYSGCDGMDLTFTTTVTNAGNNPTYSWFLNGNISGINSSSYTSNSLKNGDIITCSVTNNDSCMPITSDMSNQASVILSPNITVGVTITASKSGTIAAGSPIVFTAVPSANVTGTPVYQWFVNDINANETSSVFKTSALANGDSIKCVLATGGKCIVNPVVYSNTIKVNIQVVSALNIHNTFTPNNDGINDTWNIEGLSYYSNCVVTVYNRLGLSVFHSTGYAVPWDGMSNNDRLPFGTYYYIIDLKNGEKVRTGYVTLIR